jgi:hypothetical protein
VRERRRRRRRRRRREVKGEGGEARQVKDRGI